MKKLFLLLIVMLITFIVLCPIILPKKIELKVSKDFIYPSNFIFEEFNHLKKFSQWNFFSRESKNTHLIFFEPYIGVNAFMRWEMSDNLFANGHIEISKSIENKEIEMNLFFDKIDIEVKNTIVFKETTNHKTTIEVSFEERENSSYFRRYINYFLHYFLQNEINQSLDKLKLKLYQKEKNKKKGQKVGLGLVLTKDYTGVKYIGLRIQASANQNDQLRYINDAFQTIQNTLVASKIELKNLSLVPIVYFNLNDTINNKSDFLVGVKYSEKIQNLKSIFISNQSIIIKDSTKNKPIHKFQLFSIPSQKTATTMHHGKFSEIKNTYHLIDKYLGLLKSSPQSSMWYELNELKIDSIDKIQLKIYVPFR